MYGCEVEYFDKEEVDKILTQVEEVWKELNCLIKAICKKP